MPPLYSSLSGSSSDTSTAYSQPFSVRSLSSSRRKSSFLCLVAVVSVSFFISNMMDTISVSPVRLAEDVVALAARASVVVLFEVRAGERRGAHPVELRFAVLLERFAHHLCRQSRLHVPEAFDLLLTISELGFVLVLEGRLGELLFESRLFEAVLELVTLLFDGADSLRNRELLRELDGADLRLEIVNLLVFRGSRLVEVTRRLRSCEFERTRLLAVRGVEAFVKLFFELTVANLLRDVRVAGLIDLESLAAVWALDLMHCHDLPSSS